MLWENVRVSLWEPSWVKKTIFRVGMIGARGSGDWESRG